MAGTPASRGFIDSIGGAARVICPLHQTMRREGGRRRRVCLPWIWDDDAQNIETGILQYQHHQPHHIINTLYLFKFMFAQNKSPQMSLQRVNSFYLSRAWPVSCGVGMDLKYCPKYVRSGPAAARLHTLMMMQHV